MTTEEPTPTPTAEEPPAYAEGPDDVGKPVGPEHDKSFHVEDYYDPVTGERIATDWDTDAQKEMPPQPPPDSQDAVPPKDTADQPPADPPPTDPPA